MSHSHTFGCGANNHSLEGEREANASVVCAASCEKHLSARQKQMGRRVRKKKRKKNQNLGSYHECLLMFHKSKLVCGEIRYKILFRKPICTQIS